MSEGRKMTNVADIRAFVLAGNATFTLVSKATEQRFTYRVTELDEKDSAVQFFVNLMNGPDNIHSFSYLGHIFRSGDYVHGRKSKTGPDAPSAKAFNWFYQKVIVANSATIPEQLEFWHEGFCAACGRKLTVPESIETGLGPECRRKMYEK